MSSNYIAVIDYHMGNLRSVEKAFQKLGARVVVTNDHELIAKADKIILPGVGAFSDGMKNLANLGLIELLNRVVIVEKKPILGICLGMQLFASSSREHGYNKGLGWLDAEVEKFDFSGINDVKIKIPHVGWNDIKLINFSSIYDGIINGLDFYFVHSFHMVAKQNIVTATSNYGYDFVASVKQENIHACQFHPEKSQQVGLRFLSNFMRGEC